MQFSVPLDTRYITAKLNELGDGIDVQYTIAWVAPDYRIASRNSSFSLVQRRITVHEYSYEIK